MREFHCDALKDLPVPDDLMQKALSIPTEPRPAALPRYRRGRAVATAASILLVMLAGLSVYFLFGNIKQPIKPVAPHPFVPSSSAAPPEPPAPTLYAEDTESPSEAIRPSTSPTDPSCPATDASGGSPATLPTASDYPTSARPSKPTVPAATIPSRPTEKPAEPSGKPTEKPTVPHQKPTEKPITPTEAPTEEIIPQTDPPSPWEDPSEEPWERPTDSPWNPPTDEVLTLRANIGIKNQPFTGKVYCRIYDRNAKTVLGDPNLFTESHRADYTVKDNRLYITYRPSDHGLTVPPGSYAIAFQNEKGELLEHYYITVS